MVTGPKPKPLSERFWAKVQKTDDGCWLWTGYVNKKTGYGSISSGGKQGRHLLAHRVSYELHFGTIPDSQHVDHVRARGCVNRHCVRPDHLEAVTQAENNRRAHPGPQSHCGKGHEMTPENTYPPSKTGSGRQCRRCAIDRATSRNRKIRGEQHV